MPEKKMFCAEFRMQIDILQKRLHFYSAKYTAPYTAIREKNTAKYIIPLNRQQKDHCRSNIKR